MKIRNDFVTNSSSTSYLITKGDGNLQDATPFKVFKHVLDGYGCDGHIPDKHLKSAIEKMGDKKYGIEAFEDDLRSWGKPDDEYMLDECFDEYGPTQDGLMKAIDAVKEMLKHPNKEYYIIDASNISGFNLLEEC
jgi:hypothetical protein